MLQLHFNDFPVLETERLLLRQFVLADAPAFFRLRSNPEVLLHLDREPLKDQQEAEAFIQRIQNSFLQSEGISWAICLKNEQEVIGFAGLWRIIKENYRAEIGYSLLPAYWNQGIMTEALRAIIDFGFKKMNLHSIEADINPQNNASIKLIEKLGFIREAYFRENYFFRGKFIDSTIYSLLNKESA